MITVIRPSTSPLCVFYVGSGFATKGGTGEDSEPPHQKTQSFPFPSCLIPSLPWLEITYCKKVSLIAFRQIFPNIFSVVHIFSFIITTYLKKFIKIKSLSTKQCPPELSPWIIPPAFPILPKYFLSLYFVCCPQHVWTALPLPPNLLFLENPVDGRRIPPYFPHQNTLPHQLAIFIKSPNTIFTYSCNHCCCVFFLTSGFLYRYIMLILISWWLLNLICSMAKAMNGQNSQPLLHLSMLFGKPCFNYCLFSSLLPRYFISNFINFLWLHFSCNCIAYELIRYVQFQISENKPDETPYVML